MQGCVRVCVLLTVLCLTGAAGRAAESEHVRGTLVAIDGDLLTVEDEDEEQRAIALTDDTGLYVVTPGQVRRHRGRAICRRDLGRVGR